MEGKQQKNLQLRSDLHFLIIDDDFAKSNAMCVHFNKLGYDQIQVLPDGYNALESIIENYSGFEFILCKYKLNDMLGIDLLEELKNNLSIERIPFLVFSEDWDHKDLALVVEKGADATLNVPYVKNQLAEKISATWSRYIDPKNEEYQFEIGRRFFLEKKFTRAMEVFSQIEKSEKLLSRSRNAKAQIYLAQGDPLKAIDLCSMVIANDPDFIHSHQLLGQAYLQQGKYLEAIKALVNAIQISPKNPFRYRVVGNILSKLGKWEDLIVIMKIALDSGLEHSFIKEYLAKAYIGSNKKSEAIYYYEELVDLHPNNIVFLNNLAVCYKNTEQLAAAIKLYEKACDIDLDNLSLKFNLSLAFLADNKREEAISLLQTVLKIDPNHKKSQAKLLMLTDPEAYKLHIEKENKFESKKLLNLRPKEQRINITEEEEHEIDNIIKDIEKKNKFLSKVRSLDMRCINETALKTLESKSTNSLQEQYLESLGNVRGKFKDLMETWFEPVKKISEEVCSDISNIVKHISKNLPTEPEKLEELSKNSAQLQAALAKETRNNADLQEELYPIILQLQFQDYLTQALDGILKIFPLPMPINDLQDLLLSKEEHLVQGEDRDLYKEIVLKEEAIAQEDEKAGDIIIF
ncbi:MAG: tetratricopeptide repeat protein [Oligoflexales bacterium]